MISTTAAVLQSHHRKVEMRPKGGGRRRRERRRLTARPCSLVCRWVTITVVVSWKKLYKKQSLQWWRLKLWKGATTPVILVSCGESHCHCVSPNWHLQPKTTRKVVMSRIWLSGSFAWAVQPVACVLLTPDEGTVSVPAEAVHMLSAGLFNSAGQLTRGTVGSRLWHSQQQLRSLF